MNPYELKKNWGDKITFWGGLGSQSTVQFGSPQDILREVERLRQEMGQRVTARHADRERGSSGRSLYRAVELKTNGRKVHHGYF